MFFSMNTANAYGCAANGRSIIEHVALLQKFVDEVPWRTSAMVTRPALVAFAKRLFVFEQGSNFDWDKLLSGEVSIRELVASKGWKRPHDERPTITTLVKALDREMASPDGIGIEGGLLFLYACMSDVMHPSWGGTFLYAPAIHRHMRFERAFDAHFKAVASLFCLFTSTVVQHLITLVEAMMNNDLRTLEISRGGA